MTSTTAAHRRPSGRTGPRSAAGKRRVRLNPLRHGLTATLPLDHSAEPAQLASALSDGSDPLVRAYAAEVADAELALLRVRRAKLAAIETAREYRSVAGFAAALPELGKLERYERRAFSRRRRAAYLLMAAHALARVGNGRPEA